MPDIGEKFARKECVGSQTLLRGLDVLEAVIIGRSSLAELAQSLHLNRSTVHRLATTLVDRRYLTFLPRVGYGAGPKLLEVGYRAQDQTDLVRIAREQNERLATETGHTVHLGILSCGEVLYLDRVAGRQRLEVASRIGERKPLRSTATGKALLFDASEASLREAYRNEAGSARRYDISLTAWLQRMRKYARQGYALDLGENGDRIRCIAAPVRDMTGRIRAAISICGAAHYIDGKHMPALAANVRMRAGLISRALGWDGRDAAAARNSPAVKQRN